MKVSVIIPVYNGEKTIKKCLDSISSSSYKDLEVIVVDDGSTDNTVEILKNYSLKIIRQKNKGPAVARNNGAKHSTGELLFFFDSDVILKKNTIQLVIDTMKDKNADVVCGVYDINPANKGFFPSYKALIDFYLFTRGDLDNYEIFESRCALIKKGVFERVGGYNEHLKWGMDVENEEFGHRITKAKNRIVVNKDVQVYHHFPGFKKIAKIYFIRPYWWMQLFIQRRRFYKSGPGTMSSGIGTGAAFFSLLFLLGTIIYTPLVYFFSIFFLIFLISYNEFYFLVYRNKGILMLLKCIPVSYLFAIIIASGAFASLFGYSIKILFGIKHKKIF